jgi:apolipoprotein N-acyltransferase
VLGISDSFAEGDTTMTAQVPVGRVPTPYSRAGDWFPWACVLATALVLAVAVVPDATCSAYLTYLTGLTGK